MGKIDSTTTVLRGNATYDAMASTGGTVFGPMGTTDRVLVKTGPQINEGYLADVLSAPEVPANVKIELVKYLTLQKAPETTPASTKCVGAAGATGETPPPAEPATTGWDKVTEKAAEIIPPVAKTIGNTTKSVAKDVSNATEKSVTNVSKASVSWVTDIKSMIKYCVLGIIGLIIIAWFIGIIIYKKKHKNNQDTENIENKYTIN
jgi:hypothetical protein